MTIETPDIIRRMAELARVENRRMRENLDGAPWGDSGVMNSPERIDRIAAEAVEILRASGPMPSKDLWERLRIGNETWVQVRDRIRDTGMARRIGAKKNAMWEAVE